MAERWTEERTARLIELWNQELSAAAIAQELGGISRNGVCGRIKRLRDMGDERIGARTDTARVNQYGPNPIEFARQKAADQRSLYILQRHEEDGATLSEIANELGETYRQVSLHYKNVIRDLNHSEAQA